MKRLAFAFVRISGPALAQQPQQPPIEQALAGKLRTEINARLQCDAF
jgi:hypothetical protein